MERPQKRRAALVRTRAMFSRFPMQESELVLLQIAQAPPPARERRLQGRHLRRQPGVRHPPQTALRCGMPISFGGPGGCFSAANRLPRASLGGRRLFMQESAFRGRAGPGVDLGGAGTPGQPKGP